MISRGFLGRSRSWAAHTVDGVRGWWEVSARPEGVSVREWLPFLRARLTCLRRGHLDTRPLHSQEAAGRLTRLEVRTCCERCGEELERRKFRTAQFPRARS